MFWILTVAVNIHSITESMVRDHVRKEGCMVRSWLCLRILRAESKALPIGSLIGQVGHAAVVVVLYTCVAKCGKGLRMGAIDDPAL